MAKRAPRRSQDIPSAQNFSPFEVRLPRVLELAQEYSGDRKALSEATRCEFYVHRKILEKRQGTVWQNVIAGMVAYGIIDDQAIFTEVGAFPIKGLQLEYSRCLTLETGNICSGLSTISSTSAR